MGGKKAQVTRRKCRDETSAEKNRRKAVAPDRHGGAFESLKKRNKDTERKRELVGGWEHGGDVSCADGLREHKSNFHAVMSLQTQSHVNNE